MGQSILLKLTIRYTVSLWDTSLSLKNVEIKQKQMLHSHEVWTLAGKATKFLDYIAAPLMGDEYFYIGRVIIITVFP